MAQSINSREKYSLKTGSKAFTIYTVYTTHTVWSRAVCISNRNIKPVHILTLQPFLFCQARHWKSSWQISRSRERLNSTGIHFDTDWLFQTKNWLSLWQQAFYCNLTSAGPLGGPQFDNTHQWKKSVSQSIKISAQEPAEHGRTMRQWDSGPTCTSTSSTAGWWDPVGSSRVEAENQRRRGPRVSPPLVSLIKTHFYGKTFIF